MADCTTGLHVSRARARHQCDRGFMGRTHSTSAVAVFLMCCAFLPAFMAKAIGSDSIWVVIMAAIATAGASLVPDLDNTSSTARNSLGPVGHIVSEGVRALSSFIQTFIRTSRDDAEPNPHRGAAHTIPAAMLFGFGAFASTKLGGEFNVPGLGLLTGGQIAAIVIVFMMCHLALSGLFKPFMRKLGDSTPLGELASFAFSLAITVGLFSQAPDKLSYEWLGFAIFAGCLIHILGDAFTTSGVPLFFPFPRKGKLWWMVRFTSIKAGGVVENVIFVPFFTLLILIATLRLFGIF